MLNDTSTSGATLRADIWQGDAEAGVGSRNGSGVRGKNTPALERLPDNSVRLGVDDGDIGDSSVGSTNVEFNGQDLAGRVGMDVGLVIGELVALAECDVAGGGVVVSLRRSNLKLSLDVAVIVRCLIIVHLLAAGRLHSGSRHPSLGRSNETVSRSHGHEARKGKDDRCLLHGEEGDRAS